MTEARTPAVEECRHCGREFEPRKFGHVFCSVFCRHRGEWKPHERTPVDIAAMERLFDPARDPDERARDDDWFAESCAPVKHLYTGERDTVARRRRWYSNLLSEGKL